MGVVNGGFVALTYVKSTNYKFDYYYVGVSTPVDGNGVGRKSVTSGS